MKLTLQKVKRARVYTEDGHDESIKDGIMVKVGIHNKDTKEDIKKAVAKILGIKMWADENGKKWKCGVKEKEYEVLLISNFTLCHMLKANRLDFRRSKSTNDALQFFNDLINELKSNYDDSKIKIGSFGNTMYIDTLIVGPVYLYLKDSCSRHSKWEDNRHTIILKYKVNEKITMYLLYTNIT